MKFIAKRTELYSSLQICNKTISQNKIITILKCFLFKVDKKSLHICANDLRQYIVKSLECDSKQKFDIAIPAQKIINLLKELPEQPLIFDVDDKFGIIITAASGKYKIAGENAVDFPEPNDEIIGETNIQAADLNEGLFKTGFRVYTGDDKPAFSGVTVEFISGSIRFTSTDSMTLSTILLPTDSKLNNSCIVEKKCFDILSALNLSGDVVVKFTDRHIIFKQEGIILYSTLIDEKVPKFKSIIPDNKNLLIIDRLAFIHSIKRVSQFAYQFVKLNLSQKFSIEAENLDFNESAIEEIDSDYQGDELSIGCMAIDLIDCLNRCITDVVYIYFSLPSRAFIIRETISTEFENLMLVMPVQIA